MGIEYFCCYNSYRSKIAKLSDQEVGRLFRALMEYNETGERQELAGRENVAFDFIADDIDRSHAHYNERCNINSRNGKKGGRPPKAKKANGFEKSQYKYECEYKETDGQIDTTTPKKIDISTPRACEEEPEDIFVEPITDEEAKKFEKDYARICGEWHAIFGRKMTLQEDCAIETLMIERGAVYIMAALQRCKGREIRSPVDYISSAVKNMD